MKMGAPGPPEMLVPIHKITHGHMTEVSKILITFIFLPLLNMLSVSSCPVTCTVKHNF
jgi:predicted nucleotide-binding protein (sugar kinase/HSP70/actin superfamily)